MQARILQLHHNTAIKLKKLKTEAKQTGRYRVAKRIHAVLLNATETLWHHTRMKGTHNRFFKSESEIIETLHQVFSGMQKNPKEMTI